MQVLSEELQELRQETILTILDDFIQENYDVSEDYQMTEEDAYITSIIIEHFEHNFRFPTIEESILESVTGYDVNEELYVELYDVLMDESIGSFVAGAAHGIRNAISGIKASAAKRSKESATQKLQKHMTTPQSRTTRASAAEKEFKTAQKKGEAGGTIKQAFQQGRIDAAKQRADKAKESWKAAESRRKSSVAKHQMNVAKTGELAKKIDTGIENVKRKSREAVTAGAARVAGILGKAVGTVRGV